jgi:hypothetical protein
MLEHNVVIEIEGVGSDPEKAFVIGVLLTRIVEHLVTRQMREPDRRRALSHVTVIEEAHRLLRGGGEYQTINQAVETFAAMLAEVRAYGEGLVVAEQIPTKVIPDVIKNTALRIMHRLPAGDDREVVGASMNLDPEQTRYVVSLEPGRAAVFSEGMDRPTLVRMRDEVRSESSKGAIRAPLPFLVQPEPQPDLHQCAVEGCTLRTLADARQLVEDEPGLALWAEAALMAWLAGSSAPAPRRDWSRGVAKLCEREEISVGCVAATTAAATVERRFARLAEYMDPLDVTVMLQQLLQRVLGRESVGPLHLLPDRAVAQPDTGAAPVAGSRAWRRRRELLLGSTPGQPAALTTLAEALVQSDEWWTSVPSALALVCSEIPIDSVLVPASEVTSTEGLSKALDHVRQTFAAIAGKAP